MTNDACLRIHLLGGVELNQRGQRLPSFPTQKSRSLFAFLVLNRQRRHPREVLAGTFWGDRSDSVARRCLRTDLWRIRKLVERGGPGGEYFNVDRHEVGFRPDSDYWLDAQAFEGRLLAPSPPLEIDSSGKWTAGLKLALDLYRGDLLEGIYDDWVVLERERFRELYLLGLERLMEQERGREAWSEAIVHGQRLLVLDPLREHIHRDLMRLHCSRGDRGAALRQYEACRRLLREEMALEPMEETARLYRRIRDEGVGALVRSAADGRRRHGPAASETPPSSRGALDATVRDLTVAGRLVDRARRHLQDLAPPRADRA